MPLPPLHLCKHPPLFLVQWPVWHLSVYRRRPVCFEFLLLFFFTMSVEQLMSFFCFYHIQRQLHCRFLPLCPKKSGYITNFTATFMNANNHLKMCFDSLRWAVNLCTVPLASSSLIYVTLALISAWLCYFIQKCSQPCPQKLGSDLNVILLTRWTQLYIQFSAISVQYSN